MGLWQTGYLDKIDTGYAGHRFSSKPKEYICLFCHNVFASDDDLLQHRFQAHPYERPALYIKGEELASARKYFSKRLSAQDIQVSACTTIHFNDEEIDPAELGVRLAQEENGLKKLVLNNKDLSTGYELFIQIPLDDDLREIDLRFFEATSSGILTRSVIDSFAEATGRFTDAARYVDGIVNYLYGILAKDQKGGSSLEIWQYREKFNQALDALHDFDTQLAMVISAIINLNFNVFDKSDHLTEVPWLCSCFVRLNKILFQNETVFSIQKYAGIKPNFRIPLDSYTEKIINWSLFDDGELRDVINSITSNIDGPPFPSDDRFKLRVLAADFYHRKGDLDLAMELVKPAANDVMYGPWAARILKPL